MVEYYFTDGVWDIIKDFLIDWKSAWQKNITKNFKIINTYYPTNLLYENFCIKTNLSKKTYSHPLNPRKKINVISNHYSDVDFLNSVASPEWDIIDFTIDYDT